MNLKWLKSKLPSQQQIKQSRVYKVFGKSILSKDLWSFNKRSLARGLAVGLFIAATPTIGFQMMIITVVVLWLKTANLPIALASCWITNAVTMPFFIALEIKIGRVIMAGLPFLDLVEPDTAYRYQRFFQTSRELMIGALVVSTIMASAGYLLIEILWLFKPQNSKFKKRKKRKRKTP